MDKNYSRQSRARDVRYGETARPAANSRSSRPADSRNARPTYQGANRSAYRPSGRDNGAARRPAGKRRKSKVLKRILVLLFALAIAGGILWLVLSNLNQTEHMLPTIERIPEYTEETAVPQ